MATVYLKLPSLLTSLLKVPRSSRLSGSTLEDALADLRNVSPGLAIHLFDESGAFREHVLCFVNETNSRDIDASKHILAEGDVITILQAVSGG
jgi:molybdopterin converting factor small subunit